MNPGRSADTMTCLPSSAERSRIAPTVASVGRRAPRISSTSGITGTGLKKCMPDEPRAAVRRDGLGEPVDRDRARVRGEDRGRRGAPVELAPQRALHLEVLEDGLDDEVGIAGGGEVRGRRDPAEGRRPLVRR